MPKRHLIVRLRNWVGDVVLGVPALRALQAQGHQLQLLGKPWAASLLAGEGWPVTTLAASTGARLAQLRALVATARHDDPSFDQRPNALCLPFSLSSALEMRLAGLQAVGYRHEGRRLLLRRSLPLRPGGHELQRYWDLAALLMDPPLPVPQRIGLRLSPADRGAAQQLMADAGLAPGFIVVCPFAGGTFEKLDKRWPDFAALLPELARAGRPLVIVAGSDEERQLAAARYASARLLPAMPLGTCGAVLANAALMVANDTGPGHLAAAVGTPTLSVMGPTNPDQWRPWGPQCEVVQGPGRSWPTVEQVLARCLAMAR